MPVADYWKQLGDLAKIANIIFGVMNIVFIGALPTIWGMLKKNILADAHKSSSDSDNSMREELRKDMNAAIDRHDLVVTDHEKRLTVLETEFKVSMASVMDRTSDIASQINELKDNLNTQFKSIYTLIIDRMPKNQ
jgi:archaellum component FlaC